MIQKTGTPNRIIQVQSGVEQDIETVREHIAKKNNLIRCSNPKCGHLLGKYDDNMIDIQHRKLALIAEQPKKVSMKCPDCAHVTHVIP